MKKEWPFGPGERLGSKDEGSGNPEMDRTIEEIATKVAEKLSEDIAVGNLLLHSVPYQEGSPGIVVNEATAMASACRCIEYRPGKKLCFSRGIIGALSDEQETIYCPVTEKLESPGLEKRLQDWMDSVETCKAEIAPIPKGERLEPWLSCMSRELRAHSIEA
ncbi:hypothetical protein ES705_14821 [subsurface metagenome]